MKRLLAALLCALMLAALLPASALADYSTTSNRGTDLEYPEARYYFSVPFVAEVMAGNPDGTPGAIYIMPMPEPGHGNLGTVMGGTKLLILAERNGFFFFVTGEGHYGWNWNEWFDYEEAKVSAKRGGRSEEVDYPLCSTYGARLVEPKDADCFDEPVTMTVGELSSGRIHLMPMPEKGHGNLGVVACGEEVMVLAEKDGYYFFRTADGRRGWNGSRWFEGETESAAE